MLNFNNRGLQFQQKSAYADASTGNGTPTLFSSRTVPSPGQRPGQLDMGQMVSFMGSWSAEADQATAYPEKSMVFPQGHYVSQGGKPSQKSLQGDIQSFFGPGKSAMLDDSSYMDDCSCESSQEEDSVIEEPPTMQCPEPELPPANDYSYQQCEPKVPNKPHQQPAQDQSQGYYPPPKPHYQPPANDYSYGNCKPVKQQPPKYQPPANDYSYQDCPMEESQDNSYTDCPPAKPQPPKYQPPAQDSSYGQCDTPKPPKHQPPAHAYSYQDCPIEESKDNSYMDCPPAKPKPPKKPHQPPANDYSYADCPVEESKDNSYTDCPPAKPKPPKKPHQPPANDYSYADCPPEMPKPPKKPEHPPEKDTAYEDCPPEEPKPKPPAYDGGDQGGYWGDPHLEGFDGEKYDVMGKAGNIYNMVSDKDFQYNTKFVRLGADDVTAIGEAGLSVGKNKIKLDAKTHQALLNDQALEANKKADLEDGSSVLWDGNNLTVNSKEYNVNLKLQNDAGAGVSYIDSDVKLNGSPFNDNVKPHGLLGQTADGVKGQKNTGKDQGKQGGTVIDGTVTEYEVNDLFDTSFSKYNRFTGSES
jgi:hypothetical protein